MRLQFFSKKFKKVGMEPGALIHIGQTRVQEPVMTILSFSPEDVEEKATKNWEECCVYASQARVTWINVDGLHQVDKIKKLGECFQIHPLILEDILNTDQRPKFEDMGQYQHITLKHLTFAAEEEVHSEQISFILGRNFVLSFREQGNQVFDVVRTRIHRASGRIRRCGAEYLLYSLLDTVIDQYFLVLEQIGLRLEKVEDEVFTHSSKETLHRIHLYRRNLLYLQNVISPVREIVTDLIECESMPVDETMQAYWRDLRDHILQIDGAIDNCRDFLASTTDLYFSNVSNKLNEIMKVLTVIATIFIPLSFFVGVYGMNFEYMPELHWKWSYPLLWAFMISVVSGMLYYFRKRDWL
ncbi:MAG: magnesium/cobalt transporter CorA [bacterium]|nr:magnesium/cobalt transporter CorA [bacterium]